MGFISRILNTRQSVFPKPSATDDGFSTWTNAIAPDKAMDAYEARFQPLRGLHNVKVSRTLVERILAEDHDFVAHWSKRFLPHLQQDAELGIEEQKFWNGACSRKRNEIIAENDRAVREGRSEDIRVVPNLSDLEQERLEGLHHVKQKRAAVMKGFRPLLEQCVGELERMTRNLALALEEGELQAAENWGVDYAPSRQLVLVAWLGLEGFRKTAHLEATRVNIRGFAGGIFDHLLK